MTTTPADRTAETPQHIHDGWQYDHDDDCPACTTRPAAAVPETRFVAYGPQGAGVIVVVNVETVGASSERIRAKVMGRSKQTVSELFEAGTVTAEQATAGAGDMVLGLGFRSPDMMGAWYTDEHPRKRVFTEDPYKIDASVEALEKIKPPKRHRFDVTVEQDSDGEWNAVALLAPEHGSIHVSLATRGAGWSTIPDGAVAAACRAALDKADRS